MWFYIVDYFYMFLLSSIFRMVTFHVGDSEVSEEDIRDIIDMEISRFII